MLGWFQALLPKEDNFFRLFNAHAATLIKGAEALRKVLEGGDDTARWCQQIVDHEHEAEGSAAGQRAPLVIASPRSEQSNRWQNFSPTVAIRVIKWGIIASWSAMLISASLLMIERPIGVS